ncbi:MAG: Trp biosynthesis-associated membrane protein [Actinobacteria bacterium]|nr:Trp biosynthesis-associated membrane protein [Actinomycetota bacterium]
MPTIERPTPLRLWGFVLTVGGGATLAIGALMPWVAVGLKSDTKGVLTEVTPGVDLALGKVALALGALALIGLLALRIIRSARALRILGLVIVLAGLCGLAIGIRELATKDGLLFAGVARTVESLRRAGVGVSVERFRAQLQKDGFVAMRLGLPLVIAGGALTAAGGLLDLVWVKRRRPEPGD